MKIIEIGLPCSPSKLIGKEEIKVIKIQICQYQKTEVLYVKGVSPATEKNFLTLHYFNEHERDVNLNFIVSTEEIRVVKVVVDSTAHANYHTAESKHIKAQISVDFYEIKDNEDWNFNDKFIYNGSGMLGSRKIRLSE